MAFYPQKLLNVIIIYGKFKLNYIADSTNQTLQSMISTSSNVVRESIVCSIFHIKTQIHVQ